MANRKKLRFEKIEDYGESMSADAGSVAASNAGARGEATERQSGDTTPRDRVVTGAEAPGEPKGAEEVLRTTTGAVLPSPDVSEEMRQELQALEAERRRQRGEQAA